MTSTIGVTGAGGYIGGRVLATLSAAGLEARALARREVPWLATPTTPIELDRAEPEEIAAAIVGCSSVIHLAGSNEVAAAADVDEAFCATVAAGRRVAAASVIAGVERLVVLSTTHVYGSAAQPGTTLSAAATIPQPRHPYALARLAVEHAAGAEGPAEVVVLRLTNAVGSPADQRVDRWSLVANDLCKQAVDGPEIRLLTSGYQWRDFVPLADAATAIVMAATGGIPPGTYDLGSGTPTRVRDLADSIARIATELVGRTTTVVAPDHDGPVPEPVPVDVSALRSTGWRTASTLDEAIVETLQSCLVGHGR